MRGAREVAQRVLSRVRDGARLAWIFGDRVGDRTVLRYVVSDEGGLEEHPGNVLGPVPSLAAELPAALWHECEARDRFGILFEDLPESRPLVDVRPAEELRRAESPEVSTVLYGPIRSGIVESARWIVETAGEDFISVHPSMFFKRRELERRFTGVPLDLAAHVAEHASGATASSHAAAFSKAAEAALRLEVPERARATRAVLVEFERIHQHLDSLAKLADDGSLSVGSSQTFAAKERIHRLLAEATGNRFARGVITVGGTRFDAMSRLADVCDAQLDRLEAEVLAVLEALFSTQSLLDRLIGTGRLAREVVIAYGAVGPVARGSGVSCDARLRDGYLYTPMAGEESLESQGDAVSRALVRRAEIVRSFRSIRNALDGAFAGEHLAPARIEDGCGIARVESPQGELLYFVRFDGGIARVALRSASYANWPLFVPSLPGNIFTDFSFIEHSFGLSQAEVDR